MNLNRKHNNLQKSVSKESTNKTNNIKLNQTLPNNIAINNFHLNTNMVNFNTNANEVLMKHKKPKKQLVDYLSNTPHKHHSKGKRKENLSNEQKKDEEKSRFNKHLIESLRQQLNEISTLHPGKISHHQSTVHSKSKDCIVQWNSLFPKDKNEDYTHQAQINRYISPKQSSPSINISIHTKSKDNLQLANPLYGNKTKKEDYCTTESYPYILKQNNKKSHQSSMQSLALDKVAKKEKHDKNYHIEVCQLKKTIIILQNVIMIQKKHIEQIGQWYINEINTFKQKAFGLISNMNKTNSKITSAYNTLYYQIKKYSINSIDDNRTVQKTLSQLLKENEYLRALVIPTNVKESNVIQDLQFLETKHRDGSPRSIDIEPYNQFDGTRQLSGSLSNSVQNLQNNSRNVRAQKKNLFPRTGRRDIRRNRLCYIKHIN